MTDEQPTQKTTLPRDWSRAFRFLTPRGITMKIVEPEKYLRALNEGHANDIVAELRASGVDLENLSIYRLFLQGTHDVASLNAAVRALTIEGHRFAVAETRVSGAEEQIDNASAPQQERDSVLYAIREGETRILVICEVYSAAEGSERSAFLTLVKAIEARHVSTWFAAVLDRITRNPEDAVRFVYALQRSKCELRCSNFSGPVNPYQALILLLQFIVGAFHIQQIRSGNLRGLKKRLQEGQLPNSGQLPVGVVLDGKKRPVILDTARAAIVRLFEMIDEEPSPEKLNLAEILRNLESVHPQWWNPDGSAITRAPSVARVRRLIGMTALVNGNQKFNFKDEALEGNYPGLSGVVDTERWNRVQAKLHSRTLERNHNGLSHWERTFHQLTAERGHAIDAIVAESDGGIAWNADGTFRVQCRHCSTDSSRETEMGEHDPHFDNLVLGDGTTLRDYRVPVFLCATCGKTSRPLSLAALRRLLSRFRRLHCLACGSHAIDVKTEFDAPLTVHVQLVQVTCNNCSHLTWLDGSRLAPEERFRYFRANIPAPRRPQVRAEPTLFEFGAEEGAA